MVNRPKKASGGFQFVNISKPSDAVKHRRQVRSHAARSARTQDDAAAPRSEEQARDEAGRVASREQDISAIVTELTTEEAERDQPWELTLIPTRPPGAANPDPLSILSPAMADPFSSWIRPLTPFEGSLLKYFVKNIVVNNLSALPWSVSHDPGPDQTSSLVSWTQSAAMDAGMLSTIFLVASRSLSKRQHPEIFGPIAMKYKAECLRLLNIAIAAEGASNSDATITKTLAMASEELFDGHKPTADRHLQAAAFMINSRGRPVRLTAWQHHDNIHMWTHWPEIMAGVDSNTICQHAVAHHFHLSLRQSRSPPSHDSTSLGTSWEEIHEDLLANSDLMGQSPP